jgi:hypothetical protein
MRVSRVGSRHSHSIPTSFLLELRVAHLLHQKNNLLQDAGGVRLKYGSRALEDDGVPPAPA